MRGQEAPIAVPSGQDIRLFDVIWGEPDGVEQIVRFRFLAPAIARDGGHVGFDQAEADMLFLCKHFALGRIADSAMHPSQIVISLADQPIEFGVIDPDVTQFFEAFRPEGDTCKWEGL